MVQSEPPSQPVHGLADPRYTRALSHPLRVHVLAILEEREASPLELSRLLQADIGVVAYHVRMLHRLGLIRLERETRVRGATQRHYCAVERDVRRRGEAGEEQALEDIGFRAAAVPCAALRARGRRAAALAPVGADGDPRAAARDYDDDPGLAREPITMRTLRS